MESVCCLLAVLRECVQNCVKFLNDSSHRLCVSRSLKRSQERNFTSSRCPPSYYCSETLWKKEEKNPTGFHPSLFSDFSSGKIFTDDLRGTRAYCVCVRFEIPTPCSTLCLLLLRISELPHNLDSVVHGLRVQKFITQCALSFFLELMHKYIPTV